MVFLLGVSFEFRVPSLPRFASASHFGPSYYLTDSSPPPCSLESAHYELFLCNLLRPNGLGVTSLFPTLSIVDLGSIGGHSPPLSLVSRDIPCRRWKRWASARREKPSPQMALATARTESATRLKPTLRRCLCGTAEAVPFHRAFPNSSAASQCKSPATGPLGSDRRARFSYDDLLGLFICGSPTRWTGRAAYALLVSVARAGEQRPYRAQASVSLGGLSVTQGTGVGANCPALRLRSGQL